MPGRLALPSLFSSSTALAAASSVLLVLVTRLPLRTRYLLNWDAVQFALGMLHFNVPQHQPHPPGYIGYIALGRLFQVLWPDPNEALVMLSIAGECAGVVAGFLFAKRLFGFGAGLVTAAAMLASPLYWYYGEAGNTYALEPLLALVVASFCWRLWTGDERGAIPAAVALAAAGAVRPSTMVLLAPLFGLALLRLREPRVIAMAVAALTACSLAWIVPLIALSGGLENYLRAGLQLGDEVSSSTAIWSVGPSGLLLTGSGVLTGIGLELGLFLVLLVAGLGLVPLFLGRAWRMPIGWWTFCAAWSLPALATFLLVHIGQVVYVQVFTPALFLMLGPAVESVRTSVRRGSALPLFAGAAVSFNLAVFFLPPGVSLASQLAIHDQQVAELITTVNREDPQSTVLLTDASSGGSNYREAQFYVPEYHRVGIGRDRHGRLGEIYGDTYTLDGFAHSRSLDFRGASTFVFLDENLVRDFVADPQHMERTRFADGTLVYVWRGPAPTVVRGELWLEPSTRVPRGPA